MGREPSTTGRSSGGPDSGILPRLVGAGEVAAALGVGRSTIYRWAQLGTLPSKRIGYIVRFDPSEVAKFLRSQGADLEESK